MDQQKPQQFINTKILEENEMKKKIATVAMALCMLLTAMPSANANETSEQIPNSFTP